jgi:hypothetical protein
MTVKTKFDIEQQVYIIVDAEQRPFLVVSIVILPNNLLQYNLSGPDGESSHYGFELSAEKIY